MEEIALFEPHVSKYLCVPCDVKVTKCIKIKKLHFSQIQLVNLQVDRDLQQNYILRLFDVF